MNAGTPRVALFADCFHEVNGVAHTCRQLVRFAASREVPFLVVNAGPEDRVWTEGTVTHVEFRRGFPRLPLDTDMAFDLAFPRHLRGVSEALGAFGADVVHLTGPGDAGLIGLLLAHRTRIPVIASWHTNLHEYAGRRLPEWVPARATVCRWAEAGTWRLVGEFYRYARRTLAPNPELVAALAAVTGKPAGLMERGVDTELFHPAKRVRECDAEFRIGYIGRLSPEKNVRWLVEIQKTLRRLTPAPFQLCVVGQGEERAYLERHLENAFFRGVVRGEPLARVCAEFDALVFPSETDTYGNVVLEALASGVPALVTASGGPKFLIEDGTTGFVCRNPEEFAASVNILMRNPGQHAAMRAAARRAAMRRSWEAVCESVYCNYRLTIESIPAVISGPVVSRL